MRSTSFARSTVIALLVLAAALTFSTASRAQVPGAKSMAQSDPDEAFDPFSDYSEFDEDSDEEADINFFKNGRFLTASLTAGLRGYTGNLASIYGQGTNYGFSLAYFLDLRSALSLSYSTGDHSVNFTTDNSTKTYTGNVSLSSFNFDYKHYLSTQNVTRGLADLNPYVLLGFGQFYRVFSLDNLALPQGSQDATMGVDLGAGIEVPMMRRKSFFGIQANYHIVNFGDANKQYIGSEHLDKTLSGGMYDIILLLGMNF